MIAKAREKGLYDRLAADDLRHFLGEEGLRMRFITSSSPPTFSSM